VIGPDHLGAVSRQRPLRTHSTTSVKRVSKMRDDDDSGGDSATEQPAARYERLIFHRTPRLRDFNRGRAPCPTSLCRASHTFAALGRLRTGIPASGYDALLRPRDRAFRQALAIAGDVAGLGDP
jgi:hypothetical protein